ncbi:MAG TPA: hypothetical protein VK774_09075 [Solirubrobacteraceae bacterium]|jgi:hypothetical protein|nr:hypothetical protein [Solirubrobacteraceae bacterium]
MKRMKLVYLSLLAVVALGAFAAATASAEEGFLPKPATAIILGGKSILETTSGTKIECTKLDETTITFSSDKHGEGLLHWLGCKAEALFAYNSLADKAEELLGKFLFLVCLDPKSSTGTLVDNFGIAVELDSPLHVEVPAEGLLLSITGTMLGAILTSGKAKLWNVEFLGKKGVSNVTSCLEGANVKSQSLTVETNESKKPEALSLSIESGLLQFKEEVELMGS